jgi:hypothetical protein
VEKTNTPRRDELAGWSADKVFSDRDAELGRYGSLLGTGTLDEQLVVVRIDERRHGDSFLSAHH